MNRPLLTLGGAAVFTTILTVLVTWPQALGPSTTLFNHHDTYFSIWRIGWIAHALVTDPRHLFDANIFSPATGTLTYSDAMLLQGVLAAPLIWAGMPPTLVYNLLLFAGFAGSGVAMFVLARYLTGATGPALVAAAAFTIAPYRIEHIMHLELQWAMWIPLTLWALHRTIDDGSWRFGALAGLFFWLQVISCVYYGVFLAMLLCAVVPLLLVLGGKRSIHALQPLVVSAVLAIVLVLPYAWPYIQTSHSLGGRDLRDVVRYSARPMNYFAATSLSRLWGWTADRWGSSELRLFPGAIVMLLAAASVLNRSRRWVLVYGLAMTLAIVLSFGVNNSIYQWLFERITLLQGLRSSARFGILVICAMAALAGLGAQALAERNRRWPSMTIPIILAMLTVEGLNRPLPLTSDPVMKPASIYTVLRSATPGVVIELPVPRLSRLPGWDAYYSLWSLQHWQPLVNGYSGYYPPDYVQTMIRMESFPDTASMARLRAHEVRYLIVHRAFYEEAQYAQLLLRMAVRPEFHPGGTYKDSFGDAVLFVMEP
jgi:hypothetical protein